MVLPLCYEAEPNDGVDDCSHFFSPESGCRKDIWIGHSPHEAFGPHQAKDRIYLVGLIANERNAARVVPEMDDPRHTQAQSDSPSRQAASTA